jgi:hypothetical protein
MSSFTDFAGKSSRSTLATGTSGNSEYQLTAASGILDP